jgi:hypothetical protein
MNDIKKPVRRIQKNECSKLPSIPVPDKDEQLPVTAGITPQ